MSHSSGFVVFPRGEVRFYEYDGGSDYVITKLRCTVRELKENWRTWESADCTCGKDERVLFYSDYGFGFFWWGRACLMCMAVTSGLCPLDEDGIKTWDLPDVKRPEFIENIFEHGAEEPISVDLGSLLLSSGVSP